MKKLATSFGLLLLWAALAQGCEDGDGGGDADGDADGDQEPLVSETGEATGASADAAEDTDASQLGLSAVALGVATVSDVEEVSELLGDAPAGGQKFGGCYTTARADDVLTVDFSGCDSAEGTLEVESTTRGQATVTFGDEFSVNGVDVDGVLELARTTARPLTYSVRTRPDEPLLTADAATDERGEVTLDGELVIERLEGYATLSGQGTILAEGEGRESARRYYLGWADGPSASSQAAQPLRYALPLDECRCALDGLAGVEASLRVESVTIDLDDFIDTGDDRFEDLEFTFSDVALDGHLSVELTGLETGLCGDLEGCFTAQGQATIALPKDTVTARVEAWCSEHGTDCSTLLGLVRRYLPSSITVEVERELCSAADRALRARYPRGLCGRR